MRHTSKLSKLTHKKNSIDSFTSESRWKYSIKDDSRVGVGRSDSEQKVRDSFDDWEWLGVGGSGWQWIGVGGSGWEWMGVGGSGWECMGVGGSGWEWMGEWTMHNGQCKYQEI